jgi:hypothetical protein
VILAQVTADPANLMELAESAGNAFRGQQLVTFRRFLSVDGLSLLQAEVGRVALHAKRHDTRMRESAGTWRRMSTVGGELVSATSSLIPRIYNDPDLLVFLSEIAGEEVLPVPDPNENHVINILHRDCDVHGGHVDTYAYAFNLILHAPPSGKGGEVEVCFGSLSPLDLGTPSATIFELAPGDAYFLKTDSHVHGVRPVAGKYKRIGLNLAYANRATIGLMSYSSSKLYR